MAKYAKRHAQGEKSLEEATKLAKANQRPGQTKEQTKIIAQGIQKGIEQYKKQQKAKARELDKQLKAVAKSKQEEISPSPLEGETSKGLPAKTSILPWILLVISWAIFLAFQLQQ